MCEAIIYRNTDLELRSNEPLESIITQLEEKVFVLHYSKYEEDKYLLAIELNSSPSTPEEAIQEYYDLYQELSEESKKVWQSCFLKTLDIGYDSGHTPHCFQNRITNKTLIKLSEMNVDLGICIYSIIEKINS